MLEYLRNEGFRPEETEFGISFRFEGGNYLYFANDDDNDFFQMAYPGIFDIDEDNRIAALEAMNSANTTAKVVKLGIVGDSVWVLFEILMDSTPVLDDIVPRALRMLKNGQNEFYKALQQ